MIDLVLPTGDERRYSLCGALAADAWRVAVRRAEAGRGGSAYVHNVLEAGTALRARGPVSHFEFRPEAPALFVAGGIAEEAANRTMMIYVSRARGGRLVPDL
ncbi:hypothetical protein [Amycolatopsis sp. MtRt-6]|uniref:hypothetical protein n=1 Tax=Amycolatopsis sp. MtRt-6 TaxID=2792782 RepID=UPI001F5DCC93|nr:hypothetical protein [Amycolatopsis sp. MtRt-6]